MDKDFVVQVLEKLDDVHVETTAIKITLTKNTALLDEHIRRTNILEQKLDPVERQVSLAVGLLKLGVVLLTCLVALRSLQLI